MNRKLYWSNCFIESIRAKIKYGDEVKIVYLKARENEIFCPHFMWIMDDKVYDFHMPPPYKNHWWNFLFFKGYIRERPYKIWEKWLKK